MKAIAGHEEDIDQNHEGNESIEVRGIVSCFPTVEGFTLWSKVESFVCERG